MFATLMFAVLIFSGLCGYFTAWYAGVVFYREWQLSVAASEPR